jgi:hypothetical protein
VRRYNLFDIAPNWINPEQLEKIESLGFDFEDGEIRVTFEELCQIIERLGVIDYSKCQQEWLKIYLNKYHNK